MLSLAPLRLRTIRRLLAAYAVNQLGDWAAEIALAVAVFTATRSTVAVAAVWLVHRCLAALPAPAIVARLESRPATRLLALLYLAEAAAFTLLAVVVQTVPLGLTISLVAVDGLLAPVARALARTALLSISQPAGLHRATNALVNVVFTFNAVAAPALGGVLVVAAGPSATLLVNAGSFVAATLALVGALLPQKPAAEREPLRLRAALAYVRRTPTLRGVLTVEAALAFCLAAVAPVEVALVTDTLGAGEGAFALRLVAWGLGMIAGGVVCDRLERRFGVAGVLAAATAMQAVACVGTGLAGNVATVLAWSVLGGIGNGIYGVTFMTAPQERTATAFQSRVSALYETVVSATPGIRFVVGGVLAAAAGPRTVFVLAGAGAALVLVGAVIRLRGCNWSLPTTTATPAPAAA